MWQSYLLPEDVTPRDAQQVLAFLNAASDPRQIAEAVEFSNALDVGVRVAERILERRVQLRAFTSLEQVYAVPYVGPERFTEIVVSLSGARPPRSAAAADMSAIAAEIRDLRSTVDALRSALTATASVRVWSIQELAWLGQPITVLAHVTDAQGAALVDRAVTLTTNWGTLNGRSELTVVHGASLQTRTDALGMVKVRVLPLLAAPLASTQQDVLEVQLGRLPLASATPEQALPALEELATDYRADGSAALRDAVDIYYRQFGSGVLAAERRRGELVSWPLLPATVQCFVHDASPGMRGRITAGLGVHTVQVRNWIGAFLSVYEQQLDRDRRLSQALSQLRRDERFTALALTQIQAFVGLEQGAVGAELRHRSAERTLSSFVQRELRTFPKELQVDVLTSIKDASNTLGSGGLSVLKAVRTQPATRSADLSQLGTRVDALERVTATKAELQSLQTTFQQQEQTRDTALRKDLSSQIALKADASALADDRAQLRRDLAGLDTRLTKLDNDVANLRR